jgi:hypothetical protein
MRIHTHNPKRTCVLVHRTPIATVRSLPRFHTGSTGSHKREIVCDTHPPIRTRVIVDVREAGHVGTRNDVSQILDRVCD